jgi:tetratricopeptide (TPR) repeat protein/predicted Ser/Thr protein kinase
MSDPDQPTKATQPPAGAPRPSADQPTIVSDQAARSEMATQPPTPQNLTQTQATMLQPQAGQRPISSTDVTHLHVNAGPEGNPEGTHRGQVWGDFRIGDLLGRGGMGAVYKGMQISLDRPVAIKVLPQQLSLNEGFRSRFQLEAKAVAKLSSPHVIQVYGAGVHEGHHYFAMEYVEGEDLSRKLRAGHKPSYAEALDYVIQAARGLAAAGELGIVHRDIKPANMMVTKKNVLKLMDFGLVKLASEDHGLTMSGTIMGTVTYFSPEQGRGEHCDQRTDIYALGVVFYELLTGKLPFTGGDATSIIYQHIHQAPKKPKEIDPNIPESFQAVVLKCMQKEAGDRYQTAAELVADLERIEKGLSPELALADPTHLRTGATVVKTAPFAQENRLRRTWVALIVIAIAIGGAMVGYPYVVKAQPAPAPGPAAPTAPTTIVIHDRAPEPPKRQPDEARVLLGQGKLDDARRLADQMLGANPDDSGWKTVAGEIDAARGAQSLARAKAAFDKGDLDAAGTFAAEASGLIKDSPELKKLLDAIKDKEGARKQHDRTLTEAENLLAGGDYAKAEELLNQLDADGSGDAAVGKALARAHAMRENAESIASAVRDHLRNADQAMERKDYDAALLAYTAAKQLDPKNAAATTGLTQVNGLKAHIDELRTAFDKALEGGDLAAAGQRLDDLRQQAPGSATLAVAENRLAAAKLSNEQAKRDTEAREAKLSAQAQTLLKRIDDPSQPLEGLERDAAALTGQLGGDQRSLVDRRLEDRRQREVVVKELAALDAAVLARSGGGIGAAVDDRDFAAALAQLGGYDGLVFVSQLVDFVRQDAQTATAKVRIHHALKVYPARDLTYVYDLRRDGTAWRIAAAHLQPLSP